MHHVKTTTKFLNYNYKILKSYLHGLEKKMNETSSIL